MNENWGYIRERIDEYPQYKTAVFEKGFMFTDAPIKIGECFPFFSNWKSQRVLDKYMLYVHNHQRFYMYACDRIAYILVGHAYDPFAYEWDEMIILKKIAEVSKGDFTKAIDAVNDLSGLFVFGIVTENSIDFCGDFESMYTAYYGKINGHLYICSHEEMVAHFEELHFDPYVRKLEKYRWYYLYGEGLPGDISHYFELKKLICDTYVSFDGVSFSVKRFHPLKPLNMCADKKEYRETIERIAEVMSANLELIAKKWDVAAVSVTGGRDSKGSLAAAAHLGNKLKYFSYNSQLAEKVDCDAAKLLCDAVGVEHTTYDIPLDKDVYPEYDLVRAILCVNSNRKKFNHNDIMKRIFFRKNNDFDVEVKSWTSEIGRAYYYKKFGVRRMHKKCSARKVNVMNNIYLFNPVLMYRTDAIYRKYLKETQYNEHMFNYDWSDIIELEMRDSRWGSDVITCEHMFAYDVTIPYNNRHLGDLFLQTPFEYRLSDKTHIDFTNLLCPEIDKADVNVRDLAHDKKRMWMDRIYYFVSAVRIL